MMTNDLNNRNQSRPQGKGLEPVTTGPITPIEPTARDKQQQRRPEANGAGVKRGGLRNDEPKMHHDLVPNEELPEGGKRYYHETDMSRLKPIAKPGLHIIKTRHTHEGGAYPIVEAKSRAVHNTPAHLSLLLILSGNDGMNDHGVRFT